MAWTAPRTWVAAEVVTAALLNTHLRDNQLAVDALFDIPTAPSTGRVAVGDGTDFRTHAHLFVSSGSLLLRHEVGGIEADISLVAKGGLITGTGTGTMDLLTVGANNTVLMADSAQSNGVKWASGVTVTNLVAASRTAAAGSGTQNVTGAGFAPTGALVMAVDPGTGAVNWGFCDDDDNEMTIRQQDNGTHNFADETTILVRITDGTNGFTGVGTLTSDGIDIVWTKLASGLDLNMVIVFFGG